MAKKVFMALGIAIAILVVIFIVIGNIKGWETKEPTGVTISTPTVAPTKTVTEEPKTDDKTIQIAENDIAKVTFEKMYLDEFGFARLVFYVTNKSDQEIYMVLDDSSVNDEMTTFIGGNKIMPNKSGRMIYSFTFELLSIKTLEEVKNIEFNLILTDKLMDRITEPIPVRIDF